MERLRDGDREIEVTADEDLRTQILLFLPPKCLIRSKCVSKAWNSLISSRRFRLLKSRRFRKDISGMILTRPDFTGSGNHRYGFLPLNGANFDPDFKRLDFFDGARDGLVVLQSVNGLLLCKGYANSSVVNVEENYYVINPTTKEQTTFAGKGFSDMYHDMGVTLAFDPRKSMDYKLVCICVSMHFTNTDNEDDEYEEEEEEDEEEDKYDLRVFSSSENGTMVQTGDTVLIDNSFWSGMDEMISTGVYWNDAVHWIGHEKEGGYFNVKEERFGKFPMPPTIPRIGGMIRYVGESNDHFYLIRTECAPTTLLHIYELDKGYFGFVLRYCVDLQPVFSSFPESINPVLQPACYRYLFQIRGIVEKDEDEEESILLLTIPGKMIRFNLNDKSFIKMCDYATEDRLGAVHTFVGNNGSFPFIESLHPL